MVGLLGNLVRVMLGLRTPRSPGPSPTFGLNLLGLGSASGTFRFYYHIGAGWLLASHCWEWLYSVFYQHLFLSQLHVPRGLFTD